MPPSKLIERIGGTARDAPLEQFAPGPRGVAGTARGNAITEADQ